MEKQPSHLSMQTSAIEKVQPSMMGKANDADPIQFEKPISTKKYANDKDKVDE